MSGSVLEGHLADLRHNPKAPQYGRCGGLFVTVEHLAREREIRLRSFGRPVEPDV